MTRGSMNTSNRSDIKRTTSTPVRIMLMVLLAMIMQIGMMTADVFAGDAPATQYVDKKWENGQVVSTTKEQGDVVWITNTQMQGNMHDGWWYTRDLDPVIKGRVSVDNGATANLILMDGITLTFENGIHVPKGSTLNIYGQTNGTGVLKIEKSEADTAAIGGNAGKSNGTINIYGGTIQVTGGSYSSNGGAGIGAGGTASNESSINIYGGTITSTGGANAAGIGGGANGGHGGEISIYGGYVTANGDSGAAGIGGGEGGSGTGTFIHGGEVHANGGSTSYDGGAGIGSGNKNGKDGVVAGNVYVYGGRVYATGGADAAGIGGGNEVSGGSVEINGVNGDGAYVEATSKTLGAGIGGGQKGDGGTVVIRKGTVKATGGADGAGIGGGDGCSGGIITITGGSVEATGGSCAPGIGSGDADGDGKNGGTINITGGTVTAKGGDNGAGIGGGEGAAGGNITISNGTVTAEGGGDGAGIGGGDCGEGGTITISGGNKITATGGANGAGIGGGNDRIFTKIEISGGTIEATGGGYAAGIGSGDRDTSTDGGTINISGGNVTAKGGTDAAGIGGGESCSGGNITITDGEINATGGVGGAGIGGGDSGNGGTITIENGVVKAKGGLEIDKDNNKPTTNNSGAGIGGGYDGNGGIITIKGGAVEARGGDSAAGIGGGSAGDGGKITISGGTITASGEINGERIEGVYDETTGGAGIGGGRNDNGGEIIITGGTIDARGGHAAAGIGGGVEGNGGTITIKGGTIKEAKGGFYADYSITTKQRWDEGGAGIGGGGDGGSGGTITIDGGTINAHGGCLGAGIGGGSDGASGQIVINDGEIKEAKSGNGGAGIGSGSTCTKDNAVNVTINGGKIRAVASEAHLATQGLFSFAFNPGAAIGAGGPYYKTTALDPPELVDEAYFNGTITLNGGDVTVETEGVVPIGGTEAICVDDHDGKVYFKGATVRRHNAGAPCKMVYAKEFQFGDFSQSVSCYASAKNYNEGKTTLIVPKNERANKIQSDDMPFEYVVVGECDHSDSTYKDNDSDHDSTHSQECNGCNYIIYAAEHIYGDPEWTWAKDCSSATAEFKCIHCGHGEEVTAEITSDKPAEGGETQEKTVYTATVTFKDKEYTDRRTKVFSKEAEVKEAPKAQSLTYNAEEQALVTAGVASNGKMLYALGESGNTAPAEEKFSETIPTGINAGSYRVWYMAKGNEGYNDTNPKSLTVTIAKLASANLVLKMDPEENEYTGNEIEPAIVATCNGKEIPLQQFDYRIFGYEKNIEVGQASVTVVYNSNNIAIDIQHLMVFVPFKIVQATNNVSVALEDWTVNEKAKTPQLTAKFGADTAAFVYKKKDAEDSTYTVAVPSEEGEYTVKATIQETKNYAGAEATCDFEITHEHGWGEPSYKWAEDNSTVTATRVCTVEGKHTQTETVSTTSKVITEPTCENKGEATYTATFKNEAFATQTKEAEVPARHDWGAATYEWSDDNRKVTATRICTRDEEHKQTETVNTTSEVTTEPTCENKGEATYTATFENEAFATQTKTAEVPARGHDWRKAEYAWSEDNSEVTAKRVCSRDASHTETETVTTSKETKAATCTEKGSTMYTSGAFENEAFTVQTKTVEGEAALGHDWNAATYKWSEDNSKATATRVCKRDDEHKQTETVNTSSKVTTEPTCENKGVATYTATFKNEAFATQTKTAEVPALGHDWDAPKYDWSEDNSEVTATRVCKNNDEHKQSETASATPEVTKEPTNLEPGKRTYTASFENSAFVTQTKTEVIPALINRDELESAIRSANEDEQATATSADGKDVESDKDYASQEAHNALKQAISEAQTVLNNENATQDEINEAKQALDTAKQTFDNAKQNAQTDKSALNDAISAAKADNDATPDSAAAESLKPGTETASAEAKQAIANAIAAAEEVVNNPKATQNEIESATQAIKNAQEAFDSAKETVAVDKSSLKNEINAAEAAEEGIATSEDGKDLAPGTEYVTPDEKKALDDAIEEAKAVLDKKDATQNEINDAAAGMKTAKDTFNAAKKTTEKRDPTPAPTATAAPVTMVTVNTKTVSAAVIQQAIQAAGGNVDTLVLGKSMKKIGKKAFAGTGIKTIVVESKKLKKKSVKGSLKGSSVTTVKVKVGKAKTNKRYVRKYKKIFTKKNAGKKVKVKR